MQTVYLLMAPYGGNAYPDGERVSGLFFALESDQHVQRSL